MGITDLLFKRQKLQVGTSFPIMGFPLPALVEFDASVTETHKDETEVTGFPVEDGAEISDHIRKLPSSIEVEGVISNTPIIFLASLQATSPVIGDLKPTLDRVETGYAKLREFQIAGILVDVITSLRSYKNMALTSISVTRDQRTGNILSSILSLREVMVATAMSVDLPTPEDVGNKKAKNKGKSSTQAAGGSTASTSATQTSTAASIMDSLGGLI
jgi:hypothetical protein